MTENHNEGLPRTTEDGTTPEVTAAGAHYTPQPTTPETPLAHTGSPASGESQYGAASVENAPTAELSYLSQEQPTTPLQPVSAQDAYPAPQAQGSYTEAFTAQQSQQPVQPGQSPSFGTYTAPENVYGAPAQPSSQPSTQYNTGYHAAPAVTKAPKRKVGVGALVIAALAAGLIGGVAGAGGSSLLNAQQSSASSSTNNSNGSTGIVVNNQDSVSAVTAAAAKASPSVVTISASSGQESGTGSGIVLDNQGHILTNTHVVTLDGATGNPTVQVRTNDGRVLSATVVGTDPQADLAVIKVDPAGLVPATLGDSGKLNVGDIAVAIGAPLGLSNTVTDGIVSTLNRTISVQSSAAPSDNSSQGGNGNQNGQGGNGYNFAPPYGAQGNSSNGSAGSIYLHVIQTDAAINPGNSGGALVNAKGEVIGVNVAIATAGSSSSDSSSQSGNIGVGFSIPINYAKRIANDIIQNGSATHGQLGTTVQSQPAAGNGSQFSVGGKVVNVSSGSAAEKAGIKVGDVITNFAGYQISDSKDLTAAVREQAGGSTVKVTLLRNGKEQELNVTLDTFKG